MRGLYESRYNLAPTETSVIVCNDDPQALVPARFGLVPFWAKDPAIGARMVNARVETIAEKPAYRGPLRLRRALIPANGFYEWRRAADGSKEPTFITSQDGEPWAFAGLWESWRSPELGDLRTFTIITGAPNDLLKPLHDRMPVILRREHEAQWLSNEARSAEELLPLLMTPYPAGLMRSWPVSKRVNKAGNEGADLVEALPVVADGGGSDTLALT
jgi:putative SOS response-associated peptidase YedK